jgi:hypothetical protein
MEIELYVRAVFLLKLISDPDDGGDILRRNFG